MAQSISKPRPRGKWVMAEGGVFVAAHGAQFRRSGPVFVRDGERMRGKIGGFSPAARRRMRRLLLTACLDCPCVNYGITLTLPWHWDSDNPQPGLDAFRAAWQRFRHAWIYRFPHSAMIYRVELQTRGAPHIHAIVLDADTIAPADGGGEGPGQALSPFSCSALPPQGGRSPCDDTPSGLSAVPFGSLDTPTPPAPGPGSTLAPMSQKTKSTPGPLSHKIQNPACTPNQTTPSGVAPGECSAASLPRVDSLAGEIAGRGGVRGTTGGGSKGGGGVARRTLVVPPLPAKIVQDCATGHRQALQALYSAMWAQALKGGRNAPRWTRAAYAGGFARHGVSVDGVSSRGAMCQYLADHATKHKQAQLGYQGKQWGVLGQEWLRESVRRVLESPRDEYECRVCVLVRRALARHNRPLDLSARHIERHKLRAMVWQCNAHTRPGPVDRWALDYPYRRRALRQFPGRLYWLPEDDILRLIDWAIDTANQE